MKNILELITDLNAQYTQENEAQFEQAALNYEFFYLNSIVYDVEDTSFIPVFLDEIDAKKYETSKNKIYAKKLEDIPNPKHLDFILNPESLDFVINYDLLDDGSFEIVGADTRSLGTMMKLRDYFETNPVDKAYLAIIKTKTSEKTVLVIEGLVKDSSEIEEWIHQLLGTNPDLDLYDIFTNNEKFGKQIIQSVAPFYSKKSR